MNMINDILNTNRLIIINNNNDYDAYNIDRNFEKNTYSTGIVNFHVMVKNVLSHLPYLFFFFFTATYT